MKLSEKWLRELVDAEGSTLKLVAQLNQLGLEVDSVESAAPQFSGVVVAKVLELAPHPDADKLRVCQVDVGEAEPVEVVCGAANVKAGGLFPFAKVGAVLPGGFKIKKAKLRGVESFGMLCSEAELGLAEQADGLMELPDDLNIGDDIRVALDLDDQLIEIDLTPNRGDCLSMLGVAREISAAQSRVLTPVEVPNVEATIKDTLPIELKSSQACPRYVGRIVKGIDPNAQTPFWMQEKLRRGGIRTIHPVVDIANYVMLELGQPMHGFDLAKLHEGIIVRKAKDGEKLTLLDGSEIVLQSNSLVIADHKEPCALAGIMGGYDSAVSDETVDILFESAFFSPTAIAGRARQYGLHTDSSHRFERGVDHQLQSVAIERATALLLEIAGGQPGPVMDIQDMVCRPKVEPIELSASSVERLLGIRLDPELIQRYLQALGMNVERTSEGENPSWTILPPSYRFDMSLEADFVEEIARLYGYDQFPRTIPKFQPNINLSKLNASQAHSFDRTLVERGYQEVISYSFVDPELQQLLDPRVSPLPLKNPISSEMSVMRTNLLPGLVTSLKHNLNRQQKQIKIYEKGLKFTPQDIDIKQENVIAGLRYGQRQHEYWEHKSQPLDFYDIKGDIEALLRQNEVSDYQFEPCQHPALHPGRSASILKDGIELGFIGAVHPEITKTLSLDNCLYVFELKTALVKAKPLPAFEPISKFTQNRRDLAIVVDQAVSWAEVERSIKSEAPEFLQDVQLFDVYTGKGVIIGRKSFAIGLILQEISRTLTDKEIDDAVDKILTALTKNLGATLRE